MRPGFFPTVIFQDTELLVPENETDRLNLLKELLVNTDKQKRKQRNKKQKGQRKARRHKETLLTSTKGTCAYCGKNLKIYNMTVDHLVPQCRGGNSKIENLRPSCHRCNSWKYNKTLDELPIGHKRLIQKVYRSFNQRDIDPWIVWEKLKDKPGICVGIEFIHIVIKELKANK